VGQIKKSLFHLCTYLATKYFWKILRQNNYATKQHWAWPKHGLALKRLEFQILMPILLEKREKQHTLPALQCMTATFCRLVASHLPTSIQNSLISSMLGGLWSSKGNHWTLSWKRDGSYVRSEHLTDASCYLLDVRLSNVQLSTVNKSPEKPQMKSESK